MGQCNSNCLVHAQPSPTEKATMGQGCSSIAVHMRPPAADAISQSPPTKDEENQNNKNQEVQVSVCLDNASEHSINIRINFNMDDSLHSSHSQHRDILFTVSYLKRASIKLAVSSNGSSLLTNSYPSLGQHVESYCRHAANFDGHKVMSRPSALQTSLPKESPQEAL